MQNTKNAVLGQKMYFGRLKEGKGIGKKVESCPSTALRQAQGAAQEPEKVERRKLRYESSSAMLCAMREDITFLPEGH